ncbi:hypothetical protein GGR21_002454 [Dysgonomonas hofstadii]|uniref:Lipoprotein n=1 Tax=Dysgonomonas hofstadii TaxID=637886 RepID=A0A840CQY6_9BACT|nr:hypothetical protein [Dysgonomonas hofstadii]MBB4036548.1 hypothetical protein [Dysgonomonas hofstadii]
MKLWKLSGVFMIGIISFIVISCANKGNNIEGKWVSEAQHDYENHIVYIFTNSKYQVIINGEEEGLPLSYKIEGDTIIMDRGEHWVPIVGVQNRYIKESFSISKGIEGTTLAFGYLTLKKVE